MTEALTPFDAIAIVLILISALMAVARGFMRELATLGAFIAALAAAYYARLLLRDKIVPYLPAQWRDGSSEFARYAPDLILVVFFFILVYAIVAWAGSRLGRNIQGRAGVGLFDRLAGLVFGAARGFIAMVFFVVLLNQLLAKDRTPEWITQSFTYPYFADVSDYILRNAPKVTRHDHETLPLDSESLQ